MLRPPHIHTPCPLAQGEQVTAAFHPVTSLRVQLDKPATLGWAQTPSHKMTGSAFQTEVWRHGIAWKKRWLGLGISTHSKASWMKADMETGQHELSSIPVYYN